MAAPSLTATEKVAERLREAGLTPTRQRVALGARLFAGGHRHVTPEMLFKEALAAGDRVSLATVYNTLHQFHDAGLVRTVRLDSDRRWFDTNLAAHHHFLVAETGELIDIPEAEIDVAITAPAPKGCAVEAVDVVVRLTSRKTRADT